MRKSLTLLLATISLAFLAARIQGAEYLYLANYNANTIAAFRISPNGSLTAVGSPAPTGQGPTAIAVNPSSTFLYVADLADNTVAAFNIAGNGSLTSQGVFATGIEPTNIAVDPKGKFLYTGNQGPDFFTPIHIADSCLPPMIRVESIRSES
jgi:6-phosphogluconolactonase (cycloisomerase 2 family)